MRVLHIHWTALPVTGGVEVHCAAVVAQLAALGVDVELMTGTRDADVGTYHPALELGVAADEAGIDSLVERCRAADIVHWHNPQWHKPDVAERVSARLSGRVVFDLHNIDERRDHWAFLTRAATPIIAHSDFVAGQVDAVVPGARVEVVPLALDLNTAPYDLPRAARTVVLQPTRLTTWKGSDLSLRAMCDLLDSGTYDVAFVHAGTKNLIWPTNIPAELMARVEPWRQRGLIQFAHYTPAESWSAIATADLLLHPTADHGAHGEPFSLSVAQAVITRTPVIASESGHLPALLAGYSAALLVPPGDQQALTNAITAALAHPMVADQPEDDQIAAVLAESFATAGRRHLEYYRSGAVSPDAVAANR